MKLILFSTLLFLSYSISLYFNAEEEPLEDFEQSEVFTKTEEPVATAPPKPVKSFSKVEAPKKRPKKLPTSENVISRPMAPETREPHTPITDQEGGIFPENVVVDGDFIVAYGDLIVGDARFIEDYKNGDKELKVPKPQLWPNGVVPIKTEGITDQQKEILKSIFERLSNNANLTFPEYNPSKHGNAYALFKKGDNHCYAQVGYTGSINTVSLSEGCGWKEVFHEVMHVLGFFHEQNRFDRDDFLQVIWENIDEKNWPQFEKFHESSFPDSFKNGTSPFSYNTIMLYSPNAFSNSTDYSMVTIDGAPYMTPDGVTDEDFERIQQLYGM